ncbi:MAG TPA: lipoprotein LpqH [Mycobacterium sp.]|nr:lipoprotein LpqH [Mycobacterium sp.]
MRNQLFGLATALTAVVVAAGCGMLGTAPNEPSEHSGRITIGDKSSQTQSVTCTQVEEQLTIKAVATPGSARALLQLGGSQPVVRTVNMENIGGINGIVGGTDGKAEATANGSSAYKITGTAVVSDPAHPGQSQSLPFTIEAPC